ncbi:hypothetical protein KM043_011917 [Ampulex compressa]|nr:hypothetical protein KM043_011917 [Ampulex compressa]
MFLFLSPSPGLLSNRESMHVFGYDLHAIYGGVDRRAEIPAPMPLLLEDLYDRVVQRARGRKSCREYLHSTLYRGVNFERHECNNYGYLRFGLFAEMKSRRFRNEAPGIPMAVSR